MDNTILENILLTYSDDDTEILLVDGFDEAIIGIDEVSMRIIYSKTKVLDIAMEDMDLPEDEARIFLCFNTYGAYMGPQTPIWCDDDF